MRIVSISDTHNLQAKLPIIPDGDVLIHAGDLTMGGSLSEISYGLDWFANLPHRRKILVAGNHDFAFERDADRAVALVPSNVSYLRDRGTTINGVNFWGSPYQPEFMAWAFNLPRGKPLERVWALIPDDVDVLVTHGPPFGILDRINSGRRPNVGCEALRSRIAQLRRLRLHVFGHIHEGYGMVDLNEQRYVNASICDVGYQPVNESIVVDI